MATTLDILMRLAASRVEFVLVGGMAGIAHGSALVTEDVDICAPLDAANFERIIAAIGVLNPRQRMLPNLPALPSDVTQLAGYKNLYLVTDAGQLDIMTEITGIGSFDDVASCSTELSIQDTAISVLSLEALIRAKRALGRDRDLRAAAELEALSKRKNDFEE